MDDFALASWGVMVELLKRLEAKASSNVLTSWMFWMPPRVRWKDWQHPRPCLRRP